MDDLRDFEVRADLRELAKKNVAHYGLLNAVAHHTALAALLEKAKELLQEMKALQRNDAKRKTILAVGLSDYSQPNAWDTYKTLFKKAVDEYKADSVIAISSTGYQESKENCFAVPPIVIDSPNAVYPSLKRHGELVKDTFKYKRPAAIVGLSLELAVLLYELEDGTDDLNQIPYRKCKRSRLSKIDVFCGRHVRYKSLPFGRVGHYVNGSNEDVFIGDELQSLTPKVEYIKTLGVRERISWLVFNVDRTTLVDNSCVTPFLLLKYIRDSLNTL